MTKPEHNPQLECTKKINLILCWGHWAQVSLQNCTARVMMIHCGHSGAERVQRDTINADLEDKQGKK